MKTLAELKKELEQEIAQSKRVTAALKREERERKRAAGIGRRPKKEERYKFCMSPAFCRVAEGIIRCYPEIPHPPPHDYAEYINGREADYNDGGSGYCHFGSGVKHVTRDWRQNPQKGKAGKAAGGVTLTTSDEHNDRYGTDDALHIDQGRQGHNLYWNVYDGFYRPSPPRPKTTSKPDKETEEQSDFSSIFDVRRSLEQQPKIPFWLTEVMFVREHFADAIRAQNTKHQAAGNLDRITDIQDDEALRRWKKSHKPYELLLQIGDRDDSVTPGILEKITIEYLKILKEKYNFAPINFAIHCDEQGAPHVHVRGYFIAINENGHEVPNRDLALYQRGIRPRIGKHQLQRIMDKKLNPDNYTEGHFNNTAITFTEESSEILFQIAERYGVKIAREAYEKQGLSLQAYITRQKNSPKEAQKALELLKTPLSTQQRHECVLTILEAVTTGLSYYPTQWTSSDAVTQAEREMRPALKKAREITENLPDLLSKHHIDAPKAELEKLQEKIARTQRALGRARRLAGAQGAKRDDGATGNQQKHQERLEWLQRLALMNELLQLKDDAPALDDVRAAKAEARAKAMEQQLDEQRKHIEAMHRRYVAPELRAAAFKDAGAAACVPSQQIVLPPLPDDYEAKARRARFMKTARQVGAAAAASAAADLAGRLGVKPQDLFNALYDITHDLPYPSDDSVKDPEPSTAAWFEQPSRQPQQPRPSTSNSHRP